MTAGLGGVGALISTGAFTAATGNRSATVDVASDENAYLGNEDLGPVKKNSRDPMVELTNNTNAELTITVSLDGCSNGILYDNEGGSGCSVTVTLGSGNSQRVDIKAAVTGTIPYTMTATGALSIETSGAVEAEAGNNKGAVRIKKPNKDQDFTVDQRFNEFQIKSVDIEDNDDDDDLAKIEFRVTEGGSGGTVVGSKDVDDPPADRYKPKGNPAVTIPANAGYTIKANTTYSLTVTGYDADENFDSETVDDTT